MTIDSDKKSKSFSLKKDNVDKVERIAYEKKRLQSGIVDEMIEEFKEVKDGDK